MAWGTLFEGESVNRIEEFVKDEAAVDGETSPPATEEVEQSVPAVGKSNGESVFTAAVTAPKEVRARRRRKTFKYWKRLLLVTFALGATLCGLAMVTRSAFDHSVQEQRAYEAANRTQQAIRKIGSLTSRLHELESGARGYAISGKQMHLDQYYGASKAVPPQLDELKELWNDNPDMLQHLQTVETEIAEHLAVMTQMVELGNKSVFRAVGQRGFTDRGYELMTKISADLRAMEQPAREHLVSLSAVASRHARIATMSMLGGGALAGVALLLGGIGLYWLLLENGKMQEKLSGFLESSPDAIVIVNKEGKIVVSNTHTERLLGYAPQELSGQTVAILVPERYRKVYLQQYAVYFGNSGDQMMTTNLELSAIHKDGHEIPIEICMKPLETEKGILVTSALRDISQRKQTEQKITRLHQELEQRAAELEASNKELEAFSYSVSHDLRSPLQNIEGFSQVLLEDYGDRLDAEGQEHLNHMRSSCQQMGEIIDALLALSKMMRTEMCRQTVDLSALARQIAEELKTKAPDREVDFVIPPGLTVDADPQLLRVVMDNLLSNAWKFTSKQPRSRIEVGSMPQSSGEQVLYVRDDGAGFEMEHAAKLFTPFKRLHKTSDFQGTGIGLATVHRVVARHGGKIWAAGAVGHGATFCFTLAVANKERVT